MEDFAQLLALHRTAIERYIRYRIPNRADAEDLYQEVCTSGFLKFAQLRSRELFKPWMLSIARNRCADYFRRSPGDDLSLEEVPESRLSLRGRTEFPLVEEAMDALTDRDREILDLYFWQELPQSDIAALLGIPLGTVKSRLHTAKERFKQHYPLREKGTIMTKLPNKLPAYTITPSNLPPFPVKWDEVMGWFIPPHVGEKLDWAEYDLPNRKRTDLVHMEVVGKAQIHGIEGVEIASSTGTEGGFRFVVQQTGTHCRYLAESHMEDGIRKCTTFLDGDSFLTDWGFGPDNCGYEIHLEQRGLIRGSGCELCCDRDGDTVDILERCTVTILGKQYDTVRLFYLAANHTASEQYLDKNGRTILWRRYNRDDWKVRPGSPAWSEKLPDNERLTINGVTYVHWYDCITDYIL